MQALPDSVEHIFRAYDIRGIYGEVLTEDVMERIGRAFSGMVERDTVVVCRDARVSGESLTNAFIEGVLSSGKNVIYAGILPLGTGMYHAWKNKHTFACVTASHLSKEWNGVKFFWSSGVGFMEEDLDMVRKEFFDDQDPYRSAERGTLTEIDTKEVIRSYIDFIKDNMKPDKTVSVAIDTGNGAGGVLARELFENGGFDVRMVFEELDGRFPNRQSNPTSDDLTELRKQIKGCSFGIALDGDGDRLVIMDEKGRKLTPEQLSFIILPEILSKHNGPIIANMEVTGTIDKIAEKYKRPVHRIRIGHNYLVKVSSEKNAAFGLERSGHFTMSWLYPVDDVIAVAYLFGCVMSRSSKNLSEMVDELPVFPFEQINFDVPDERKFSVMNDLKEHLRKIHPNINTMDGVRIDFDNGWVLMRPSNTSPKIRLTIEANTEADFSEIRREYTTLLEKYINT